MYKRQVLVGLAASGRTPYVIGAMEYAHSQNAFVAIVSWLTEKTQMLGGSMLRGDLILSLIHI